MKEHGGDIPWDVVELWMIALLVAIPLHVWARRRKEKQRGRKAPGAAASLLDTVLLMWTPTDPLRVRDLLNGGICIMGRPGSAKTTGSGLHLGLGLVGLKGSGGLILAAKPEDLAMWQSIFRRAGRERDLLVFSPETGARFNLLDYEMRHSRGQTRNLTKVITTVGESLKAGDTRGDENGGFWEREHERNIQSGIEILKHATGKCDPWDLQRLITDSASSPELLMNEEKVPADNPSLRERIRQWKSGFHCQMICKAMEKKKTAAEEHDFKLAMDYWCAEIPSMADKTRSSIFTGVLGILHVFNTGVCRELMSTGTNVSPDDQFDGKWVLVDMSPAEWAEVGRLICAGWKYSTQKAILRRHADERSNVVTIWVDEAGQHVSGFDGQFAQEARSHRGLLVYLFQSRHSLYATLKGQSGKQQADMLLAQFGHKIFHALGSPEDAEYGASLVGKSLQYFPGGGPDTKTPPWEQIMGRGGFKGSFSTHYEHVLQANEFMHGLRCGGPPDFFADSIVVKTGEPFLSNGRNWLRVAFSQKV
jgi:hypothetical protein